MIICLLKKIMARNLFPLCIVVPEFLANYYNVISQKATDQNAEALKINQNYKLRLCNPVDVVWWDIQKTLRLSRESFAADACKSVNAEISHKNKSISYLLTVVPSIITV